MSGTKPELRMVKTRLMADQFQGCRAVACLYWGCLVVVVKAFNLWLIRKGGVDEESGGWREIGNEESGGWKEMENEEDERFQLCHGVHGSHVNSRNMLVEMAMEGSSVYSRARIETL